MRLDGSGLQSLESYRALVARWNRTAGLVSRNDLGRFFERHVLDSLILAPMIREREKCNGEFERAGGDAVDAAPLPIADFGSGGGLPGIPLAIALPMLTFTLIDRSEKKVRFLRRARDELKLANVRVLCADVRRLQGWTCRAVVARAAMPLRLLWTESRAVLAPGGYLLVLDRIVQSREPPESDLADLQKQCERASIRRHWTEMPQSGGWHGVLDIREVNP